MTTFVMIPGAGGEPWEWHLLGPELERLGIDGGHMVALSRPGELAKRLDAYLADMAARRA